MRLPTHKVALIFKDKIKITGKKLIDLDKQVTGTMNPKQFRMRN